jgi:hypothetical protein
MVNEFWNNHKIRMKRIGSIITVLIVLGASWWAFLKLAGSPPLDTTTSMIMVWLSFVIIIFTLFPGIINRVKRVKIKGIEFELNEAVAKATSFDYMTDIENIDYRFSRKGDFTNLVKFFNLAKNHPDKPILLLINLQNERYISVFALFIYLYFLDLINPNITCLFFKSRNRIENWKDLVEDEIVGVSNGKVVLQSLLKSYPKLLQLVDLSQQGFIPDERMNLFSSEQMENAFRIMYERRQELNIRDSEFLSTRDIINIIGSRLTKYSIDEFNNKSNFKLIYNALMADADYFLIFQSNKLHSVLPTERLSKMISIKAIREMIDLNSKQGV